MKVNRSNGSYLQDLINEYINSLIYVDCKSINSIIFCFRFFANYLI